MAAVNSASPTPMNSAATLPLPSPELSPLSSLSPSGDEVDDSDATAATNRPTLKRVSSNLSMFYHLSITHTRPSLWRMRRPYLLQQNVQAAPPPRQAWLPGALEMQLTLHGAYLGIPNGTSREFSTRKPSWSTTTCSNSRIATSVISPTMANSRTVTSMANSRKRKRKSEARSIRSSRNTSTTRPTPLLFTATTRTCNTISPCQLLGLFSNTNLQTALKSMIPLVRAHSPTRLRCPKGF
jgi:hypothetical protein